VPPRCYIPPPRPAPATAPPWRPRCPSRTPSTVPSCSGPPLSPRLGPVHRPDASPVATPSLCICRRGVVKLSPGHRFSHSEGHDADLRERDLLTRRRENIGVRCLDPLVDGQRHHGHTRCAGEPGCFRRLRRSFLGRWCGVRLTRARRSSRRSGRRSLLLLLLPCAPLLPRPPFHHHSPPPCSNGSVVA
jgi:hypothetical protein